MFRRNLIPVWVGISLLCGMFLMGQEAWEPQPTRCEDSEYPTCDGECDVGLVCTDDPALGTCRCQGPCEATAPTCGGDRPLPLTCVSYPPEQACRCFDLSVYPCEETSPLSPQCGGSCPDPRQSCVASYEDSSYEDCVCARVCKPIILDICLRTCYPLWPLAWPCIQLLCPTCFPPYGSDYSAVISEFCEEYPEECQQAFDTWVESLDTDEEESASY